MSTITITISIDVPDGAKINVSQGTAAKSGGTPARRSEPLPKASGRLRTDGDPSIDAPGKKGGRVSDMEDKDLSWWRDKLTSSLHAEPDGRFAAKNADQLAAIETEMAHRADGGGPQDFAHSGGSDDDSIPF